MGPTYLLCTGRGVSWAGGRTPSLGLPGVKGSLGPGRPLWARGERAASPDPGDLASRRSRLVRRRGGGSWPGKDACNAPRPREHRPAREMTSGPKRRKFRPPPLRPPPLRSEETPLSWAVIGPAPAGDAQAQPPGLCAFHLASGRAVGDDRGPCGFSMTLAQLPCERFLLKGLAADFCDRWRQVPPALEVYKRLTSACGRR